MSPSLEDFASERSPFHVHAGDCLDLLRSMRAAGVMVDSIITDPPSAIAFMGKAWDTDKGGRAPWCAWLAERFEAALHVVPPGAHGLVWALPRTSHWTGCALEDAGWEIVDVITHIFAQGRPAGLDVGKAIDKAAGAEREVTGTRTYIDFRGGAYGSKEARERPTIEHAITAPATEDAKRWDGWSTRLKPCSEHWYLIRKPFRGSVAANVLEHGAGALNNGACMVPRDWTERGDAWMRSGHSAKPDAKKIAAPPGIGIPCNPAGGVPGNVVYSHAPDCRPDETCVEGCPVRELDEQRGVRKSGSFSGKRTGMGYRGGAGTEAGPGWQATEGGASRFYHQFYYHPKANRSERDEGLHDGSENQHATVKPIDLMRLFCRLVTPGQRQLGRPGRVLDLFGGSGSIGVAARLEGFHIVAAELPESAEGTATLCAKRIAGALGSLYATPIERPASSAPAASPEPEQRSLFKEAR